MTYWHGFVGGVIVGFSVTLVATGHIAIMEFTELSRIIAWFALFIVFLVGLLLTFYHARYRKSFFDPTTDGLIIGIGFIEAIIVFVLYGFQL